MGMSKTPRTPAVDRAVAALDIVAHLDNAGWTDIGRQLGLAKSSTTNLVETMITGRLLRRHGSQLVLGGLIPELANGFVGHPHVLRRFGLGWDKFPGLMGHTLTIQSLLGYEFMYLDVRLGSSLLPYTPRAGSRFASWQGGRAEPAMHPIPPEDIALVMARFQRFHGKPEMAQDIIQWALDRRATEGSAVQRHQSIQGNDELTTLVTRATERSFPVTLSLHLSRDSEADIEELSLSLRQFAATLTT